MIEQPILPPVHPAPGRLHHHVVHEHDALGDLDGHGEVIGLHLDPPSHDAGKMGFILA